MAARTVVIASTARTGLAKSFRGGFNKTHGAAMLGHAIEHAVQRAKIEPSEVDDVIAGCGFGEGATGMNIGRNAALWAGLPATTSGATINRFCASGLQAVASAAGHVASGFADVAIGAGVESISMVQPVVAKTTVPEKRLLKTFPALWMPMIETADILAKRYDVSREDCDAYALECQKRTAHAQSSGFYEHEIVPMDTIMTVKDKEKGTSEDIKYTVSKDECNRPSTTLESLQGLQPVRGEDDPHATVTAGNASQLSDGAAACVVMDGALASQRGVEPLGIFKGYAVAGCAPDEMGVGPVHAVPKLLGKAGLSVDDIDLWEINEAFACVPLYAMRELGIDPQKANVNGGSIAIGHPFGMTGARQVGHILLEGQRRKAKHVVVSVPVSLFLYQKAR
jgi:acetyl-CoA C-acetyltransferase